jgi:hypothetical protein
VASGATQSWTPNTVGNINEANDEIQAQISEKEKQIDAINQEIKKLAERQILVSVQEYKKQL